MDRMYQYDISCIEREGDCGGRVRRRRLEGIKSAEEVVESCRSRAQLFQGLEGGGTGNGGSQRRLLHRAVGVVVIILAYSERCNIYAGGLGFAHLGALSEGAWRSG